MFRPQFQEGLRDLQVGEDILVLTWLDRADRQTLSVPHRDDPSAPQRGVFSWATSHKAIRKVSSICDQ